MVSGRPISTVISGQAERSKDSSRAVRMASHLIRRQDAGGAAAHVEGAGPQMVFPHHFSPSPDLRDQGLYIGLHQRKTSLHALTDKGAVGATGGTEGNTHIQVDIPLFQPLQRLIAHGTSLQSQRRPLLRDEIARLQFPLGFLRGLALHQRPCDGLVGPDAGEHPQGGSVSFSAARSASGSLGYRSRNAR